VDWAESRVIEICARHDVAAVVIDKASAAASLVKALTDAHVQVVTTESAQMRAACGQFYDAVMETGELAHLDDPLLVTALKAAVKRKLLDSWAWDKRKSTDDITPLVAATLALWGHATGVGVVKNAGKGRVVARR
jgi:phage terminase large subunit-like protein